MSISKIILDNLFIGESFQNPGRGIYRIIKIEPNKIMYQRGNSKITIKFSDIDLAYSNFKGTKCTTSNLKNFKPEIFDTSRNGHSYNCIFFFLLLKKLDLIDGEIYGNGLNGDPFHVFIK